MSRHTTTLFFEFFGLFYVDLEVLDAVLALFRSNLRRFKIFSLYDFQNMTLLSDFQKLRFFSQSRVGN